MKRHFYLIFCGMFMAVLVGSAQSKKDVVLNLVENDSLINAVTRSTLIDKSLFSKDTFIQKLRLMLESAGKYSGVGKPSIEIGWDGYFFAGTMPQSSSVQEKELFSRVSLSANSQFFGLPIQLFGQVTSRDLVIDRQLSDFSISFDQRAFLQRLHQRFQPNIKGLNTYNKQYQALTADLLQEEEKKALISEVKHRIYKAVLDCPSYWTNKNILQAKLDSLSNIADVEKSKFTLDSLRLQYCLELELMNKVEVGYRQTWDYKCLYNDRHLLLAKDKLKSFEKRNETWADPRTWMRDSLQSHMGIVEKVFVYTRNFDLGQFNVKGSDFTLFQMPLQGVHIETEGKNWFVETAQGRLRFQQGFAPSYGSLLFSPRPNKNYSFVKAGLGRLDASYFYVALLHANQTVNTQDSLSFLRKSNLIWEVGGKVKLYHKTSLEVTSALGKISNGGTVEKSENEIYSLANAAMKANIVFGPTKQGNRLGLGYFFTGSSFISFGNPFLHTNWRGLNVDAKLSLLQKRVFLNGALKYGNVADEQVQKGKYHAIQFYGQAGAKISKTGTLSISFLPNVFRQSNQTQDVRGAQSIYQLQFAQLTRVGKSGDQLTSSATLSNYRFNYQLIDTLDTSQVVYGTLQENMTWSNGNNLSGSCTFAKREQRWFRDWLCQLEFGRQLQKLNIKGGLQALSQPGYQSAKWGVSLGIQSSSKSRFRVAMTCIYRKPLIGAEPDQILGNVSTHYIF